MLEIRLAFNHIFKNKLKFVLIFSTILLASIVLNVNMSFDKIIMNERQLQLRQVNYNSQIVVTDVNGDYFDEDNLDIEEINLSDNVETVVKVCSGRISNNKYGEILIIGQDVKRLLEKYNFTVKSGSLKSIKKGDLIITDTFAKNKNISAGDTILLDKNVSGTIAAIIEEPVGYQTNDNLILCELDFARQILNFETEISELDITISKLNLIGNTQSQIQDLLGNKYNVTQTYTDSYYESFVGTISLTIKIMAVLFVILTIYVIVSVLSSLIIESYSEMMTLRSIGMTINAYRRKIIIEVEILTISALILGLILYFPIILLIERIMFIYVTGVNLNVILWIAISIGMCLIVLITTWCAICKMTKVPIVYLLKKGITDKVQEKKSLNKYIVGILSISFLLLYVSAIKYEKLSFYFITLILGIIVFLLLQKELIRFCAFICSKILSGTHKEMYIFSRQLKYNTGSYIRSISIMCFVTVIGFLALNTSDMLSNSLNTVYKGADIYLECYDGSDENISRILNKNENIRDIVYQKRNSLSIMSQDVIISGVKPEQYIKYDFELSKENRKILFNRLNEEDTILVTTTFMKNTGKKVGDKITVQGHKLTIVGSVSSIEQMGSLLFISEKNYNNLFSYDEYSLWLFKTDVSINSTIQQIEKAIDSDIQYSIMSVEEMREQNEENDALIFNLIYILCVFSLVVSSIALVSNLIINMERRKNDFLIYKTIGINNRSVLKVQVYESGFMGAYCALMGTIGGIILTPCINKILSFYIGDLRYSIDIKVLLYLTIMFGLLNIFCMVVVLKKKIFHIDLLNEARKNYM